MGDFFEHHFKDMTIEETDSEQEETELPVRDGDEGDATPRAKPATQHYLTSTPAPMGEQGQEDRERRFLHSRKRLYLVI